MGNVKMVNLLMAGVRAEGLMLPAGVSLEC